MKKSIFYFVFLIIAMGVHSQVQTVKAELSNSESNSMILVPDPQSYIKFDVNQPVFELMTAWITNNIENLNIKGVLCVGDLVEQNNMLVADGINGNQTSREQWQNVSRSFERLDNKVPYVVCTGNHDYGYVSSENRLSCFPDYFYPERNSRLQDCLVTVTKNWKGIPTLENAAYEFELNRWGTILVISLEFAPRDEALEWAKELAASEKYKNHTVLLMTHSYMDYKGDRFAKENYKISPANYGQAIWEKLVYPSPNIRMVLCGHDAVTNGDDYKNNVSFRTDKNVDGRDVFQMMWNAQTAGGGWHGNGGDGWLRIMEFVPDGKTIRIKTFSPLFAISPTTAKYAWRTESFDQFEFTIQ